MVLMVQIPVSGGRTAVRPYETNFNT